MLVRRGVARRRVGKQQQVPSQKEAEPSEETPDDGGRWREGELGAQVSRVIVIDFAMGFDCGPQARKAFTRWKASWVLRTLILKRLGGNENPRSSDSNRGTRRKTSDPAADRAAWSRLGGVRRRHAKAYRTSEVGASYAVKAPTADKNRRRGSASAKGCRWRESVAQVFSQARVSNPNQIARSPVGCATMSSPEAGASE